ncbi:MAG TPA: cyclase family protein, partial [Candidatus Hypogeohydataceae bacterium YC41]
MTYVFLVNLLVFLLVSPSFGEGLLDTLSAGKTKVIDLTYSLSSKNPYWPGESYQPFKYEIIASMETHRVFSGRYSTPEHLGTHIDAPIHFEPSQPSVDKLPLENLVGPAVVIDVSLKAEGNPDYRLKVEDVADWEKQHGVIPEGTIVLLYTGWSRRWNDYEKYKNADNTGLMHFPGFSRESALFLADNRKVKALGLDTLSVDYGPSTDFPVHHVFLSRGLWVVENLANLDKLP